MPNQLFMVMRGERPKRKRRTKENIRAYARVVKAQSEGMIADIEDISNMLPALTKPEPNPYPARKIGRPNPRRLLPAINESPSYANKPKHGGGFWTSTYLRGEKHPSEWAEWCYYNTFPYAGDYRSWVLEVDPAAFVLEIDDPASCEALMRLGYMYPDPYWEKKELDFWRERPQLDFEKLAEVGVHGVHLTSRGNSIMHLNLHVKPGQNEFDFNGWDSESTVWLRWAFTRVRVGPKVHIPMRNY
jgi:hypothetical protein